MKMYPQNLHKQVVEKKRRMVVMQLLIRLPLLLLSSFPFMEMAASAAMTEMMVWRPVTGGNISIPYPLFGLGRGCYKDKRSEIIDNESPIVNGVNVKCWKAFNYPERSTRLHLLPPREAWFYLETRNMLPAASSNSSTDIKLILLHSIAIITIGFPSSPSCSGLKGLKPFNQGSSAFKSCNTAVLVLVGQDFFLYLYVFTMSGADEVYEKGTFDPAVLTWFVRKTTQGGGRNCTGYAYGIVAPVSLEMEAIFAYFIYPGDIDQWKEQNFCTGKVFRLPTLPEKGRVSIIPDHQESHIFYCTRLPIFPILYAGITCLVLFLHIGSWLYRAIKEKRDKKCREMFSKLNGHLLLKKQISCAIELEIFFMDDMKKATANFNKSKIIGEGGSSTVYEGKLEDGRIIAVKHPKVLNYNLIDEFIDEVVILSRINHRNVVQLLGCCLETQVPLLVYEFVQNGTLAHHLHDEGRMSSLSWGYRLRIASEVASAIAYMHSLPNRPIIHRDIKSSNILLDENFTAKVSDFGVSRPVTSAETHVSTMVRGTLGYLDPEYYQSGQLTDKSDVYSFGVVLAELLIGEKAVFSTRSQEAKSLAVYFVELMKKNLLIQSLDTRILVEGNRNSITKIAIKVAMLAQKCLRSKGKDRPSMQEVAAELHRLLSNEKFKKRVVFKKVKRLIWGK